MKYSEKIYRSSFEWFFLFFRKVCTILFLATKPILCLLRRVLMSTRGSQLREPRTVRRTEVLKKVEKGEGEGEGLK